MTLFQGNKVVDGRLIRPDRVILPHQAWCDKERDFLGGGIDGTGFTLYMYCMHPDADGYKVYIEVALDGDDTRTTFDFNDELQSYPWDVKEVLGCLKLVHDLIEALMPPGLVPLNDILDLAYEELDRRRDGGHEPLERK